MKLDEHDFTAKAKEFLDELEEDYECALREYYCNIISEPKELCINRYIKKEAAKSRLDGALEMCKRIFKGAKV